MADVDSIPLNVRSYLAAQPVELPVFHPIAIRLQRMLASDDYTVNEVAEVANDDQALASQMLKVANSPFYAGRVKVATIKDAILRLGARQVANLAMAASQAKSHTSANAMINGYMKDLWQHSHACAFGSKWVAENAGFSTITQEAFLAGLLHDIGKLFLLKGIETAETSKAFGVPLSNDLIKAILDSMHVEQGCRLMAHWNFPENYIAVVRGHHLDDWDTGNDLLAIVRLVNLACIRAGIGLNHDQSIVLKNTREAEVIDAEQFDLAELEGVLEDSAEFDL